jgi:hypothetical protein
VRQLGVSGTPALCVLRRRGGGVEKYLEQAMPRDLATLLEWAEWTANFATPGRPAVDPALARTSHSAGLSIQASPQAAQVPPQAAAPAAPAQAFTTVPMVTTPTPPPVALALSSPPIYLQQAAPTVVVGPTPPANVFVTQAASYPIAPLSGVPAPSPQAGTAQPPLQLTLAAPQAHPSLGLLQTPTTVTAPTAQAAPGIGLVLCNPNAIDRLIGAIGRLLAQRGLPRLQMNAATPATFTPTMVPVSQAGLPLTLGQPQQPQTCAQTPPAVPQAQQPPVMPSPQVGPSSVQNAGNSSLWSRLFHKN